MNKPIVFYLEGNDMFVDIEYLEKWRKSNPLNEIPYCGLIESFGGGKKYRSHPEWKPNNVFLFDVNSCPILKVGKNGK